LIDTNDKDAPQRAKDGGSELPVRAQKTSLKKSGTSPNQGDHQTCPSAGYISSSLQHQCGPTKAYCNLQV